MVRILTSVTRSTVRNSFLTVSNRINYGATNNELFLT